MPREKGPCPWPRLGRSVPHSPKIPLGNENPHLYIIKLEWNCSEIEQFTDIQQEEKIWTLDGQF